MSFRVCVHGLGTIGLPTAALLAEAGHEVAGCDISRRVVAAVNAGRATFREPGLDELVASGVTSGRLRAAATPVQAEYHVVAVPTPFADGHRPDLSCVEAAVDALLPLLRPGDTVILESTVPVGTTERLAARIAAARPDLILPSPGAAPKPGSIHLAHCPERVIPGRALHELTQNDRVVGGLGAACAHRAADLYCDMVRGRIALTDCRTAELVKLAENAYRDVNIAFANEMAAICGRLGVDPWNAIALANRHPRVSILAPGAGVGGHCIAVDPWFLVHGAPEEARLIRTAREVNGAVPPRVLRRIRDAASRFEVPRIACLGLAYKPDADDLRESPALGIVHDLARDGREVTVADPFLRGLPPALATLPNVALRDAAEAVLTSDVVAVLVAHTPFRGLDPRLFEGKQVVDAVGLLAG